MLGSGGEVSEVPQWTYPNILDLHPIGYDPQIREGPIG
jgi:hypothetical protein